jgi:hypothetical protein
MKSLFATVVACTFLTCCSEPPSPKAVEKPPEPVTGRYALQQVFIAARTWSPDLQILNLTSMHFSQVPDAPGKAGGWQVTFVSPGLQQSRTYTFAGADISPSIHKGITDERPNSWSGGATIPMAAVKIDSDDAYKVAVKNLAKYAEANPKMVITYQLTLHGNSVVWRVIWGENVATSSDSVLVDASTGEYMGTLH